MADPPQVEAHCPRITRGLLLLLPFFMSFYLPACYGGAKAAVHSGHIFCQSQLTGTENW